VSIRSLSAVALSITICFGKELAKADPIGYRLSAIGYRLLAIGYWLLAIGYWLSAALTGPIVWALIRPFHRRAINWSNLSGQIRFEILGARFQS
jgi:hypothetical protein